MFNKNIYMTQIDILYHELLSWVLAGIDFGFVENLKT